MPSLYFIILFPLLGFLINGIWHLSTARSGKKLSATVSGGIATLAMVGSFIVSAAYYFKISELKFHGASIDNAFVKETLFSWMKIGSLNVDFALSIDSLSMIFCLVITGVGSLIHLYSMSYMHDDDNAAKYFSYLNLFCFMMLNLVLGSTLPHVFLGWEGVGLASYLLIGFWYEDGEKVLAGQKAFIMNRIGDVGFLLAMFVAFKFAGTLDLKQLNVATLSPHVVTVFGLLLFFACTGKSAQIPLFTWLPDAMAGPTPVSALIHAATMVTSGIYILARLNHLILESSTVLGVIAVIGGLTALVSAIIACSQTDIKKVLAFSTVSQLGFMFAGVGVGSFNAGIFHVMTHAFFKALLFLGAGSVIHALSGEQDIFKMGSLRKKLPITFLTFTAGWAAILGLPPFSGFFSKDEIIFEAFHSEHANKFVFALLLISALLTAFYMTRLYVLVFFGQSRLSKNAESHLHESPLPITIPLVLLSVLSLVGGWFGAPIHLDEEVDAGGIKFVFMAISVAVALIGAFVAWNKYSKQTSQETVKDPFRLDLIYDFVFVKGTKSLATGLTRFIEENFIQRSIRVTAAVVDLSGNILKVTQVGSAQAYLLMIIIGVVAILWKTITL